MTADSTILAAAHCVEGGASFEVETADGQSFTATESLLHPDWNPFTLEHNLGLIYLPEPMVASDDAYPSSVAQTEPAVGDNVISSDGKVCTVAADESVLPEENPNLFCMAGDACENPTGSVMPESNTDEVTGIVTIGSIIGIGACATSMPVYYDWIMANSR